MESIQVEYGIACNLPWAMVCNVPSAVDMVIGDALLLQSLFRNKEVRFLPAFSDGQYGEMFAKEQTILSCLASSFGFQQCVERLCLDAERVGVVDFL